MAVPPTRLGLVTRQSSTKSRFNNNSPSSNKRVSRLYNALHRRVSNIRSSLPPVLSKRSSMMQQPLYYDDYDSDPDSYYSTKRISTAPQQPYQPRSYSAVKGLLTIKKHQFAFQPKSPHPTLLPSNYIADLQLHPVVESALHILNLDLNSAHFLLRHMQAPPAHEAMFLHGVLHRVEGDYDNARSWYGDVATTNVFKVTWPDGKDDAMEFIDKIEEWSMEGPTKERPEAERKAYEARQEQLRKRSLEELNKILWWCERKYGTDRWEDASGVWVKMSDKHRDKHEEMVTGGEGWREF